MTQHICEFCGGEFESETAARYCSDACRRQGRKWNLQFPSDPICQNCGVPLPHGTHAHYCSDVCRRTAMTKLHDQHLRGQEA